MSWLCWIGLHRWKNRVLPPVWIEGWGYAYEILSRKCVRCGKVKMEPK